MKNLIKLEEAAMFLLAVFLFYWQLDFKGWVFWALLLAPDVSMLGYLINTKTGAFTYNLFHHKLTGILFYLLGIYLTNPEMQFVGLLLFAHSSMDRVFGYGLKFSDNFHNTHLGMIGKAKS
ncbi:MAG: DUF4260 domain-containing protein [Bacteroidetes bacterium]|nr:DUF4260 domain-containing protein [Bacteroidota bacterium]